MPNCPGRSRKSNGRTKAERYWNDMRRPSRPGAASLGDGEAEEKSGWRSLILEAFEGSGPCRARHVPRDAIGKFGTGTIEYKTIDLVSQHLLGDRLAGKHGREGGYTGARMRKCRQSTISLVRPGLLGVSEGEGRGFYRR